MSGPVTLLGLRLRERRVVFVGGGEVTARRVRDVLTDGAVVTVIAPEVSEGLARLLGEGHGPRLTLLPRPYAGAADLEDAWLVHTATGDPRVDAAVSAAAESARIWCIDATDAERGSAQVPARGAVTVGDPPQRGAVHRGGASHRRRRGSRSWSPGGRGR